MYAIMIVEDEELIRQGLTSLVDYEQFGEITAASFSIAVE